MASKKLVIASGNIGKIKELSLIFDDSKYNLIAQTELRVPEVEEPFDTFIENALQKARNATRHTGLASIADDSGICVPALEGHPGVHSARFSGKNATDYENNQRLIECLKDVDDRSAYYYCILVLVRSENDPAPLLAEGRWLGEILLEPVGNGGFGYDPIFRDPKFDLTGAQMSTEQKNNVSHRGVAARKMQRLLEEEVTDWRNQS